MQFVEDKPDSGKRKTKKKEFRPPKKITEKYLYNSGLAYLQRFTASSMHFKTVMKRKIDKSCRHHTDQDMETCLTALDNVTERLREYGYLDDTAYLNGMVYSLRRRGLSLREITAKLMQKGYKAEDAKKTVQKFDEEHNIDGIGEIVAALAFARKKRMGPFDALERYEHDKVIETFGRKGYSYDVIKKMLAMDLEEAENNLYNLR